MSEDVFRAVRALMKMRPRPSERTRSPHCSPWHSSVMPDDAPINTNSKQTICQGSRFHFWQFLILIWSLDMCSSSLLSVLKNDKFCPQRNICRMGLCLWCTGSRVKNRWSIKLSAVSDLEFKRLYYYIKYLQQQAVDDALIFVN